MKRKILSLSILALTFSSVIAQVNITFELNTATISSIDLEGIFIAGGIGFGVPGDNQLTDPDGDGIYSITFQKEQGFSSYYTFLNGNCPTWDCKEDMAGLPCVDPSSFNDRFLPSVMSDTTILACFGNCVSDGTCGTTSINGLKIDENLFTLRPTLVNNYTNIAFGESFINKEKQIVVMNSAGQILHTATVKNVTTYQLKTAQFNSGIYFLSIKTEVAMLTKRFVVQK